MTKVSKVIELLENIAPQASAEVWDNPGWQINLHNEDTQKILLAVSVTMEVLKQARDKGCDLVISHHPMFFVPLKNLSDEMAVFAVQNNIQVYSAHTNLDKAIGGTTDALCIELGFNDFYAFNDYVKIVELEEEMILDDILTKVKEDLNLSKIRLVNNGKKVHIKKIALSAGAGGDFVQELETRKIDLYITSDIKYHTAIDAKSLVIADIGHLESEAPVLEMLKTIFDNENIETSIAKEYPVFKYV